jgi:hypothetical protein
MGTRPHAALGVAVLIDLQGFVQPAKRQAQPHKAQPGVAAEDEDRTGPGDPDQFPEGPEPLVEDVGKGVPDADDKAEMAILIDIPFSDASSFWAFCS